MRKAEVFVTIAVLLFSCGCGTVPLLTTPTRHEKKVPAEYNLAAQKDKKVMVVVYSPAWVTAPASIVSKLTDDLEMNLTEQLKLECDNLILYENLKPKSCMSVPPGPWLGKDFGADLVLYAELHEFNLEKVTETDYYKGQLEGKAALFEAGSEHRLWPQSEPGKVIRIAFDVEQGDYDKAIDRLSRAFAHCTTRYLYDCPVAKFKIFEDKSGTGWENWRD
jgi:hypothetical protein